MSIAPKDVFLDLMADATKWHIETDETGTVHTIVTGDRQLANLVAALGIDIRWGEPSEDAIQRAIDSGPSSTTQPTPTTAKRLPTAPPGDGVPGMVLVPKTALDWLFGEGPDADGHWFGDGNFSTNGTYWWRAPFRAMIDASSAGAPSMVRQPDRWPRKGDTMRFLNRHGYDFEREAAAEVMTEGQTFTVKKCDVGSFSHSVQFEEIAGSWNGVMFELLSASTAGEPKP